ncbi:MAG TPA: hypothetical protein VE422_48230 [Terriglobia bacterium]|nr:hypothetical protein [Terriglobia bacterium]
MIQTANDPQLDERIWQAWLKKNAAQDKFRFERRVKVLKVISVCLALGALLWAFTR